jgi:hypothetical protein
MLLTAYGFGSMLVAACAGRVVMTGLDLLSAHVDSDLNDLDGLSSDDLKALYIQLTNTPLPKFLRGKLLRRAVTHAFAEKRGGSLYVTIRGALMRLYGRSRQSERSRRLDPTKKSGVGPA